MKLYHYRGLNCYLASIVSIAASLGVRYQDAFATLWTETEFAYVERHRAYASIRVLNNLRELGVSMDALPCATPVEAEAGLLPLLPGAAVLVGMDTFYIPWSPLYQYSHDQHYFFACREAENAFTCYDPVYNKTHMPMKLCELAVHADEITRVRVVAAESPRVDVGLEAEEVLRVHPALVNALSEEIRGFKGKQTADMSLLIARVDALINNRHLFMQYLHSTPHVPAQARHCFDGDFLPRWEAVKNGLIKASIVRRNEEVIDEVCGMVRGLLFEEMHMAREIMAMVR